MCDEADGGLLVWHLCSSIIYASERRGGGSKCRDGSAGNGSAGRSRGRDRAALLLEMPPLTYFSAGTIPIPHFFRLVTALVPCGLVLDVGHLWTVYRYTDACRRTSLERFVREFLDEFPLERVVEIHVAGLACHESVGEPEGGEGLPEWIDAHAVPIPSMLF